MASLFRNRFTRPAAPRRRRVRAAAPAMPLERLEPRLALAGDTFSRPMLERAATLVMDASFVGPNPVVMSKSQVVGNEVKSFVISHVPEGSVVEKWDAATEKWIDVSTEPTSSNPQELMRLLGTRVIHQGDKIQWRPKTGFEGAAQQAFQMINWDDGSELAGPSADAPGAVQNLAANPTGVGNLTLTWQAPASGDATSYTVTVESDGTTATYITQSTQYSFTDLNVAATYNFSVTASLPTGTSPASTLEYAGLAIATLDSNPISIATASDGAVWVLTEDGNLQRLVEIDQQWRVTFSEKVVPSVPASTLAVTLQNLNDWLKGLRTEVAEVIAIDSTTNLLALNAAVQAVGAGGTTTDNRFAKTAGWDRSLANVNNIRGMTDRIAAIEAAIANLDIATLDLNLLVPSALTVTDDGDVWIATAMPAIGQFVDAAPGFGSESWAESIYPQVNTAGFSEAQVVEMLTGLNGNGSQSYAFKYTNQNGSWALDADSVLATEDIITGIASGGGKTYVTAESDSSAGTTGGTQSTAVKLISDSTIQQADATSSPPLTIAQGPSPFNTITVGDDGTAWLVVNGQSAGELYSATWSSDAGWSSLGPIAVVASPSAVTTSSDGSVWVANTSANSVQQVVYEDGEYTAQAGISVGVSPIALTAGPGNTVWVASSSNTVQSLAEVDGTWGVNAAVPSGNSPVSLATTSRGRVLAANYLSETIQAFDGPPVISNLQWSSDAGGTTLTWEAEGGVTGVTPTYSVVASQGDVFLQLFTSDTSALLSGMSVGNGPVYFSVGAESFTASGNELSVFLADDGSIIPTLAMGLGITTDGIPYSQAGFDGDGNTYSWTALGDTSSGGALVGNTLVFGGLSFEVNPNQPDFTWAAGQDIAPTGTGNVLTLAAAAVNGNQTDQQLTLNFTDGTSATWTQSFSDWLTPQSYSNELTISTQSYRNTTSGGKDYTSNYLYSYSYALPEGKTLESITLPNNADVRLLGAVLTAPQTVDLTWGDWGIANGKTNVSNSDGFDGNGNYYYSGTDVVGDLPSPLVWGGVIFDYGPTSTTKHGTDNLVRASGQEITITAGTFSSLCLAAAAANGSQTDQVFTLKFSDGSQETWTQSLSDWCDYEAFDGQAKASTQDYRVRPDGNTQEITNYVYGYAYQIPEGKTLTSITLPDNSDVGILAMTLV